MGNGEACPGCGRGGARRAGSAFRHWLRLLVGSRKRQCRSCGKKWLAPESVTSSGNPGESRRRDGAKGERGR